MGLFNRTKEKTPEELEQELKSHQHYVRGMLLEEMDKHEDAIRCYDLVLELNPDYFRALYNKAIALFNLKRYKEAISCCQRAIKINDHYFRPYHLTGRALACLGMHEDAVEWYKGAFQARVGNYMAVAVKLGIRDTTQVADSYDVEIFLSEGVSLMSLQKYEAALQLFERCLNIIPDHQLANQLRVETLKKLGCDAES